MNDFPTLDPLFLSEVLLRDPSSSEWIERLPEQFKLLAGRWSLSLEDRPRYGKTSVVLPVQYKRKPAALKLVSPVGNVESEARALQLFEGSAAVQVFESSIPHRALLLERLPGPMLVPHDDPTKAVEIAGRIAGQLGTVESPTGVPSVAVQAIGWPTGIRQQHERAVNMDIAVPNEIFADAVSIIVGIANDKSTNLTHGDLSLENIMRTSSGSWVAIDPLLLRGTVTNEAHTVVRSLLPLILDSETPVHFLANLTKKFCDTAGIDYQFAQQISLARYLASYYWEAQNNGDPANIDRLRRATTMTWELIA